MDTKRLILAMVIMTGLILGWQVVVNYLSDTYGWRKPGEPRHVATDTTTQPATAEHAAATSATSAAATNSTATITANPTSQPATATAAYLAVNQENRTITIGSDQRSTTDPFKMRVDLSSQGAGIEQVTLNEFDASDQSKRKPDQRQHYTYQQPFVGLENLTRPLASTGVTINGQAINLAAVNWLVSQSTDNSVTFSLDISSGQKVVARLYKTFTLTRRDDTSLGYEVKIEQRAENLTDQPLNIAYEFNGPVSPLRELLTMDDRQILAAYQVDNKLQIQPHVGRSFNEKTPKFDLTRDSKDNRFVWFGASSVYFNALVRPQDAAQIKDISAGAINPTSDPDDRLVTIDFTTNTQTIAAGQTQQIDLTAFFGPKKREILNTPYYAAPNINYGLTLTTLNSGCANWCTAQWIIDGLVWLLGIFHWVFRDWGIAIICLVVVVRTILHPITKRSTISMHKMGKMGPEMERLKKKHGDNKEELNKAMMQMYKQQGATPILGCLPMFLQMPIWIALWSTLQNTMELRQAPFLYGWLWINDLSKPDALLSWSPVPLMFGWKLGAINILPILMAVVFYLQQKFTPKPATASPEQAKQQKMMLWMTVLLFPLFLYNGPSGLNLYILTSTTIGIIEMRRIRNHIQAQEEKEKLEGPVRVEAGPTRMGKQMAKRRDTQEAPKKGLAKWLADLQQKAEEMRSEQQKRKDRN
ncbi:MAG: membrane protein insertase YidC [Phycisphaerales bacterium]|nr:membrane protein insertase YidC [Phycisphaerales bacterium]